MSDRTVEFFEKMQEIFPSVREEYIKSIDEYGEVLETVVIEDIFMPMLLTLLYENNIDLSKEQDRVCRLLNIGKIKLDSLLMCISDILWDFATQKGGLYLWKYSY